MTYDGPDINRINMASGDDWVMRPVLEGLISYDFLVRPGLSLGDIARMNDALDVMAENDRRVAAATAKA